MGVLDGQVSVITGAANGIGRAIALKFAEQGSTLAILDSADLEEVEHEINQLSAECKSFSIDVTNRQSLTEVFARIYGYYSKIDALVNVAGICIRTSFLEMTDEEMDRTLDVNFKGVYNCAKLVLPSMVEKKRGTIISISSVTSKTGVAMASCYAASKER